MFLSWYDPDRKKPARLKLEQAIERYTEKFGRTPSVVLTNPVDADALRQPAKAYPDPLPLPVEEAAFVSRWTFYIGGDMPERSALAA